LIWAVNKDVRTLVEELPVPRPESPLEPQWSTETLSEPASSRALKHCPFCAETIRAEAIVCRYCSRDVPGENIKPSTDLDQQEKRRLQSLLDEDPGQQDRNLLDVFDYARLLEQEESAAVLTLVTGSSPGPSEPRSEDTSARLPLLVDHASEETAPDQARVAAR
jgi:hypothetical protein